MFEDIGVLSLKEFLRVVGLDPNQAYSKITYIAGRGFQKSVFRTCRIGVIVHVGRACLVYMDNWGSSVCRPSMFFVQAAPETALYILLLLTNCQVFSYRPVFFKFCSQCLSLALLSHRQMKQGYFV